jgi:hypothetical protein
VNILESRWASLTRRVLWFATAYTIVIIVHEAAHAAAARGFGFDTTLYHFWVNFDADRATPWQRAVVGLAGPVSSLLLGMAAWVAYRATSLRSSTALPFLYLAACGVSNFFGNMMSAAFVGDFSNVAIWLELPMAQRYALSVSGAIVAATALFIAGRELARWSAPTLSRGAVVLEAIVLPALIGTAIIIVINQPNPIPGFAAARAGEAAFWVFGAGGASTAVRASNQDGEHARRLCWRDGAVAGMVLVVVRVMALGIPLNP